MWQEFAACGEDWFDLSTPQQRSTCATCVVADQCLSFAIRNEDFEMTIYGGYNGKERREYVRRKKATHLGR